MIRKTHKAKGKAYVYYNCGNNKRTHQCSPHSFSEAKLADIVFHAIHDQIEVVLHLDKVLCFIDSLPQRDRRVFSYEAQMTRLEEEIQRYKSWSWASMRTSWRASSTRRSTPTSGRTTGG